MLDILTRAGCYIAIIILGYILRKRGFFGEETFGVLSKIVIKITLPAAIVYTSAGKALDGSLLTISALSLVAGGIYMLTGYFINRKRTREERAFALLNTAGYNIGTFALPFTQSFLGPMGVVATNLFDVGNSFVCLGGAYSVASVVKQGQGFSVKRVLTAPLKSIPFLTHIVMVCLNLNGWHLPDAVVSFAGILGNANAFLAMLMIGVGFKLSGDKSQIGTIVRILGVRYSLGALFAAACYFLLPFSQEIRQALVILCFSPIASAVPIFTAELKEDAGLSSAINSISIVCSIVVIVALLMVMF